MLNGLLSTTVPRNKPVATNYYIYKYAIEDPYLANVVLFLKGDGENNSTNIVDNSSNPKTITRFGDTKISTALSKYGGSSIYFDGSDDYLDLGLNPDFDFFNISQFTIEGWFYRTGADPLADAKTGIIFSSTTDNTNNLFILRTNETQAICNGINYAGFGTASTPENQWHHFAVCRNGGSILFFINGILRSTGNSSNLPSSRTSFRIGRFHNSNSIYMWHFKGYMDSIRVTKNICRYTTDFNPETDTYLGPTNKPGIIIQNKVPTFLSKTYSIP